MLDTEQARGLLHRQDASLVSVRSWPELIGKATSGYSEHRRRATSLCSPPGPRWERPTHHGGFLATRTAPASADDIAALWRQWNILRPSQQAAFYWGTGWRASETFCMPALMAGRNVVVDDGGWYERSSNPHIRWPAESAARKAVSNLAPPQRVALCRRRAIPRLRCGRYPL